MVTMAMGGDGYRVLLVLCVFTALDVVQRSYGALADWKADMDEFILDVMQCRNVAGLGIALVSNGEVLLTQGYGKRETDPPKEADENTLFPIGSLTKAFTSAVIADILSSQSTTTAVGNTTWDTPLIQIVGPTFALDGCFRTQGTTLRDLLCHRVGLEEEQVLTVMGLDMNKDNFLQRVGYLKEKYSFRSQFFYSNFMYTLAGRVAEALTGMTYQKLIKDRLFGPLGMTSSRLTSDFDNLAGVPNLAKGYATSETGEVYPYNVETLSIVDVLDAAGSVMSTAKDMATWMIFQMNGGRNSQGRVVVDADFLRETQTAQMSLHDPKGMDRSNYPVEDTSNNYAMGWIEGQYRGYERLGHTGNIASYSSLVWMFPGEKAGVFISINSPMDEREVQAALKTIAWFVSDKLLEQTPWMSSQDACRYPEPWVNSTQPGGGGGSPPEPVPTATEGPNDLNAFVGTYGNMVYGSLKISVSGSETGDEHLRYAYGDFGSGRLYATHDNHTFKASIDGDLWYWGDNMQFNVEYPGGVYMKFSGVAEGLMHAVHFPGPLTGGGPEFERDLEVSNSGMPPMSQACDGNVSAGAKLQCHVTLLQFLIISVLRYVVNL